MYGLRIYQFSGNSAVRQRVSSRAQPIIQALATFITFSPTYESQQLHSSSSETAVWLWDVISLQKQVYRSDQIRGFMLETAQARILYFPRYPAFWVTHVIFSVQIQSSCLNGKSRIIQPLFQSRLSERERDWLMRGWFFYTVQPFCLACLQLAKKC